MATFPNRRKEYHDLQKCGELATGINVDIKGQTTFFGGKNVYDMD